MANQDDQATRESGISRSFGQRVRRAREEQGWTQRQLADALERDHRIKLDSSAITRIESGSREPRLGEAVALADLLDFPLSFGGLTDDFGGEAQFANSEARLKRDMALARRRILGALAEVHIAFDGLFGDDEELLVLRRRGATTAVQWAERIRDEMATRFSVPQDEAGAANHVFVTDPVHREVLEIIVGAIVEDLYRTEEELSQVSAEEMRLYREDLIRRAKESLIEAYGEEQFTRRFGAGFDEAET